MRVSCLLCLALSAETLALASFTRVKSAAKVVFHVKAQAAHHTVPNGLAPRNQGSSSATTASNNRIQEWPSPRLSRKMHHKPSPEMLLVAQSSKPASAQTPTLASSPSKPRHHLTHHRRHSSRHEPKSISSALRQTTAYGEILSPIKTSSSFPRSNGADAKPAHSAGEGDLSPSATEKGWPDVRIAQAARTEVMG